MSEDTPERVYADPPREGAATRALARVRDAEVRRLIRHEATVRAARAELPETWTEDGVTFQLLEPPTLTDGGAVQVYVLATTPDGEPLPTLDNPYLFDGAPLVVATGTWRLGLDQTGEPVDLPNVVEDPAEALRQQITLVVLNQARAAGGEA